MAVLTQIINFDNIIEYFVDLIVNYCVNIGNNPTYDAKIDNLRYKIIAEQTRKGAFYGDSPAYWQYESLGKYRYTYVSVYTIVYQNAIPNLPTKLTRDKLLNNIKSVFSLNMANIPIVNTATASTMYYIEQILTQYIRTNIKVYVSPYFNTRMIMYVNSTPKKYNIANELLYVDPSAYTYAHFYNYFSDLIGRIIDKSGVQCNTYSYTIKTSG